MTNRYACIPLLAGLLIPAAFLHAADVKVAALTPVVVGNVSYLVGGVGDEDELAIQGLAHEYSLLLAFTEKDTGHYIGQVQVTLKDRSGKPVLDVESEGPCFFAKLQPGQYSLLASYQGQVQKRSIEIKEHGQSAMVLRWEGSKKKEPRIAPGEATHLAHGCWR